MVSNMEELSNCSTLNDKAGTFTVSTLGIRPFKDLTKLHQHSSFRKVPDICFARSSSVRYQLGITSRSWEIQVAIHITDLMEEVGLSICHNKGKFNVLCAKVECKFAKLYIFIYHKQTIQMRVS
jgi:hypothetical protein